MSRKAHAYYQSNSMWSKVVKRLFCSFRFVWAAVAFACIASGNVFADQLIVNGGFETGDFTGWTINDVSFSMYVDSLNPVHSGTYSAQIAGFDFGPDTLSQTVATVAGQSYALDFWFWQDTGTPNGFIVDWNGTVIYSETDYTTAPEFREFQFNVVGTGNDTLTFTTYNNPAFAYIDDVSLVGPAAVPEPSSLALLSLGGIGLGLRAYRRRHAVV